MKITAKSIIKAASDASGVKVEHIELFKDDGFYYWGGEAGACMTGSCIYVNRLTDFATIDRWVADFMSKCEEAVKFKDITMQEYIDSIDWRV